MNLLKPRGLPMVSALLASVLLLGCPGGGGDRSAGPEPLPPVLLITVDGLIADELSAFGGQRETPALDSLVSSATVWRDGWTACPMTRPAVATYLTGLAPDRHGVVDDISTRLGEQVPTLAGLLQARGYATAAFPGSSLLGQSSRLLREFDVVDDPPPLPFGPSRLVALTTHPAETANHVALWLERLGPEEPWFAWIHLSGPLLEQFNALADRQFGASGTNRLDDLRARAAASGGPSGSAVVGNAESAAAATVEGFDAALGTLLAALESRGETDRALVLLAPTLGDVEGGTNEPPGPGFSLEERAIRVPFVARFPSGAPTPRPTDLPVWAPDVAATVAGVTGTFLAPEAEGISLLESPPDDRVLFSWSWAPRDQMGWLPLRAARSGPWKRIEGSEAKTTRLDGFAGTVDSEADAALTRALNARSVVPAERVELQPLQAWFRANELSPEPLPAGGRAFEPADARRDAAALVWSARLEFHRRSFGICLISWRGVLQTDPGNRAALLGIGQTLSMLRDPAAETFLRRAVHLYPGDWDVLHWMAHGLWSRSWRSAEELLLEILPHRPDDPDVLYDLACARSLDGDPARGEEFLRAALDAGFRNWELVETDPDLRGLRESPRFAALLREYGR